MVELDRVDRVVAARGVSRARFVREAVLQEVARHERRDPASSEVS
jgi:metal-responsive CopG/Arc/MetJ family transcriptional regulator